MNLEKIKKLEDDLNEIFKRNKLKEFVKEINSKIKNLKSGKEKENNLFEEVGNFLQKEELKNDLNHFIGDLNNMLFLAEPFIGHILISIRRNIISSKSLSEIAYIGLRGNYPTLTMGTSSFFSIKNKKVEDLKETNTQNIMFIYLHEVYHYLHRHIFMNMEVIRDKGLLSACNRAMDLAINEKLYKELNFHPKEAYMLSSLKEEIKAIKETLEKMGIDLSKEKELKNIFEMKIENFKDFVYYLQIMEALTSFNIKNKLKNKENREKMEKLLGTPEDSPNCEKQNGDKNKDTSDGDGDGENEGEGNNSQKKKSKGKSSSNSDESENDDDSDGDEDGDIENQIKKRINKNKKEMEDENEREEDENENEGEGKSKPKKSSLKNSLKRFEDQKNQTLDDFIKQALENGQSEEAIKEEILRQIILSAEQNAQKRGRGLDAGMYGELIEWANKKPMMSYKTYINKIARKISSENVKTMRRPNRRLFHIRGDIKGKSLKLTENELLVMIDTSGSMSAVELSNTLSELKAISKRNQIDVRIIVFDAAVNDDFYINDKKGKKPIEMKGRGGTCIQPAINYIYEKTDKKDRKYYKHAFIFTDGEAESSLDFSKIFYNLNFILTRGKDLSVSNIRPGKDKVFQLK